jgi:hypothetical protein
MARGEDDRGEEDSRPEPVGGSNGDALRDWYRRRDDARRHYTQMPPYRIRPEEDGRYALSVKRYEFWDDGSAQAATRWRELSRHEGLEDAERRLRHVTSPTLYYDERGRIVLVPPEAEPPPWALPPDDEDDDELGS